MSSVGGPNRIFGVEGNRELFSELANNVKRAGLPEPCRHTCTQTALKRDTNPCAVASRKKLLDSPNFVHEESGGRAGVNLRDVKE